MQPPQDNVLELRIAKELQRTPHPTCEQQQRAWEAVRARVQHTPPYEPPQMRAGRRLRAFTRAFCAGLHDLLMEEQRYERARHAHFDDPRRMGIGIHRSYRMFAFAYFG